MTMDGMNKYLEVKGFEVSRVYDGRAKHYSFTITKDGHSLTKEFKYPATDDWNYRNEKMEGFLDRLIAEFELRYSIRVKERENKMYTDMKKDVLIRMIRDFARAWEYELHYHDEDDGGMTVFMFQLRADRYPNESVRGKEIRILWEMVENVYKTLEHIVEDVQKTLDPKRVYIATARGNGKPSLMTELFDKYLEMNSRPVVFKVNQPKVDLPVITNVIFNDPATIVFWADKTKTVVKCGERDIYDPEKGLAMAIVKKALGNEGNYYNEIKKWLPEMVEKDETVKLSMDVSVLTDAMKNASDAIRESMDRLGKRRGLHWRGEV